MYVWVVLATRSFPFLIQEIILKILWQSLIYWSVFVCLKIKNVCCGRSILFDYLWIIIQLAQFTVWTWLHDTIPTLPMLILNIKLEMIIKKKLYWKWFQNLWFRLHSFSLTYNVHINKIGISPFIIYQMLNWRPLYKLGRIFFFFLLDLWFKNWSVLCIRNLGGFCLNNWYRMWWLETSNLELGSWNWHCINIQILKGIRNHSLRKWVV